MLGNGSDLNAMEYGLQYNPPMKLDVGERNLKEATLVLDQMGLVVMLGAGTCLGAIRDKSLIPWDDDIDLYSVMGINGLTENAIANAIEEFKRKGYSVKQHYSVSDGPPYAISHSIIKDYARVDWICSYVVDDVIWVYPGILIPAHFFINPQEIEFLGEQFYVPSPPEEYLRLKYGDQWMIPKKPGEYELDVVTKVPGRALTGRTCRVRLLDHQNEPVPSGEIVLVGGGISKTNQLGYADVRLPIGSVSGKTYHALIIRYPGHEQVLYEEELEPDCTYVYKPDSYKKKAAGALGEMGTLGNVLIME